MAWTEGGNAKLAGKGPGRKTTPPHISMPGWYAWLLSNFVPNVLTEHQLSGSGRAMFKLSESPKADPSPPFPQEARDWV
jgi:hypothetical protein